MSGKVIVPHVDGLSRLRTQQIQSVLEDARFGLPRVDLAGSQGELEEGRQSQGCQLFGIGIAPVGDHPQGEAGRASDSSVSQASGGI